MRARNSRAKLQEFPVNFRVHGNFGREWLALDCPLRQPVWTVEKFPNIASKNAGNCGHSAIHTLKPDQRNRIAKRSRSGSDPFFSGQQKRSPVSTRIMGERNAITNRRFSERDLTSHAPDHRYGLLFSLPQHSAFVRDG